MQTQDTKAAFEAMREALEQTLLNARSPEATDWPVVVERIESALKLAEGGIACNSKNPMTL